MQRSEPTLEHNHSESSPTKLTENDYMINEGGSYEDGKVHYDGQEGARQYPATDLVDYLSSRILTRTRIQLLTCRELTHVLGLHGVLEAWTRDH